jgi:hypothetical protein
MDCFAPLAMTVWDVRATQYSRDADDRNENPVAICNRLARRNISLLAKALPTGQKKAGNKKRQRRTI